MLVLHVHWRPPSSPVDTGGMLFWAETSQADPPGWRRGRLPQRPRPKDHPFCALPQAVGFALGRDANRQSVTLQLPSSRSGPLPSPRLIHSWNIDEETEPFLTPWKIKGLWLPPVEAMSILVRLPSVEAGNAQYFLGNDARFWHHAAALALEALAAQKLVPILVRADPGEREYHARWLPVLDSPDDAGRLAQLEAIMPPLCRAGVDGSSEPPSPHNLLITFLNTSCDALARQLGRAGTPYSSVGKPDPVQLWIAALFSADPTIKASPAQLQALEIGHRAWMRNLFVAGDPTFRIA
ncbi:MAG TPA: hypothetical protein VIK64_08120, partial [Anaerolineales bacterium]